MPRFTAKIPLKARVAPSKLCNNIESPQDVGEDEAQTGPRRRQSFTDLKEPASTVFPSSHFFHHVTGNAAPKWATERGSYSARERRQSFPSKGKLSSEQSVPDKVASASLPRPVRRQSVGTCSGESRKLTDGLLPILLRSQLSDFVHTDRQHVKLGDNTTAVLCIRSESRDDYGDEVPMIQPTGRRNSLAGVEDFGQTTFEATPALPALLRQKNVQTLTDAVVDLRPHQPRRRHSYHGNFTSMLRDVESAESNHSVIGKEHQAGKLPGVAINASSVDPSAVDNPTNKDKSPRRNWKKSARAVIFILRLSRRRQLAPIVEALCETADIHVAVESKDDVSANSGADAAAGVDDGTTSASVVQGVGEIQTGNGKDPDPRNGEAGAAGGEGGSANDGNGDTNSGSGDQENAAGAEDSGGGSGGDGGGRDGDGEEGNNSGRNVVNGSNLRLELNRNNNIPSLRTLCLQTTFTGHREPINPGDQSTLSGQTLARQQFFFDGRNVVCAYCPNEPLTDEFVDLSHSHRSLNGETLNSMINPQLVARFQQLSRFQQFGIQPRDDNVDLQRLNVDNRD